MEDNDTLGVGEMDDINLPLDEIIQRKAQQTKSPTTSRFQRRGRGRRGHARHLGHAGTGVFHGEVSFRESWPMYDANIPFQAQPQIPQLEFEGSQYWNQQHQHQHPYHPIYPQPPPPPTTHTGDVLITPPPNRDRFHSRVFGRGGIRKPISDRRRGGRRPIKRETPPQSVEKPKKEEEKCTMAFEQGNVTIMFNNVEILKVSAQGDMILTTDGHQDDCFLKALNGVLALINVEILAEDRPESWKVKAGFSLFRFFDGIEIKGKGDATKKRAELIKKAFEQPNPKALEATLASNLAARRLGLAFDSVGPIPGSSGHAFPPSGSIKITQDQHMTRTSKYSISFVKQNKDRLSDPVDTFYGTHAFPSKPAGEQSFQPY